MNQNLLNPESSAAYAAALSDLMFGECKVVAHRNQDRMSALKLTKALVAVARLRCVPNVSGLPHCAPIDGVSLANIGRFWTDFAGVAR